MNKQDLLNEYNYLMNSNSLAGLSDSENQRMTNIQNQILQMDKQESMLKSLAGLAAFDQHFDLPSTNKAKVLDFSKKSRPQFEIKVKSL